MSHLNLCSKFARANFILFPFMIRWMADVWHKKWIKLLTCSSLTNCWYSNSIKMIDKRKRTQRTHHIVTHVRRFGRWHVLIESEAPWFGSLVKLKGREKMYVGEQFIKLTFRNTNSWVGRIVAHAGQSNKEIKFSSINRRTLAEH